ncbi:hypothetical protein BDY19DRAFT_1075001 [Irpex rosettiformis]|uniref:Uncharacterized protein n=1 Tax=Irpex rosettiformis TaxID=378272 RepID=A0ACB8TWD9_9APHY|nr:hypothetical protein BDY19DRAFT_1075001 [Irpex rosettiformis]
MPLVPVANSTAYQVPSPPQSQQQLVFDFTKRKRWADLLVSELTEAIMLILSQNGQVWYCGPAVAELLGWKDEEVTDTNICDIMNPDDRATFLRQFKQSIQNRTDLLAYARLQCKTAQDLYPNVPAPKPVGLVQHTEDPQTPPREVLFEIKGYPHFVGMPENINGMPSFTTATEACVMNGHPRISGDRAMDEGPFRCFFAMAKPYPSRNTAMLNTFLELKMENERLQSRLQAAKAQAESLNIPLNPPAMQRVASGPSGSTPAPAQSSYITTGQSYPYEFQTLSQSGSNDSATYRPYEMPSSSGPSAPIQSQEDDHEGTGDSGQLRKKLKRSVGSEMYVCTQCGRTDSPEWRKGPQGPKTLCNACGLRWAKSNRGPKEGPTATPSASATAKQHSFSVANFSSNSATSTISSVESSATLTSSIPPCAPDSRPSTSLPVGTSYTMSSPYD